MRCSDRASGTGEPAAGTAGDAVGWLALEEPGPWGPQAPADSRLPAPLAARLHARATRAGVRVLLIRRLGRYQPHRRTCLLAHAGPPDERFLETVLLDRVDDVLELDLEALGRGEQPGAGPATAERHYLTCTNGRRDPCCAALGRPVARALGDRLPGRAWQTTHLGGHRFAANVLVLPDGLLFGRLDAGQAVSLAAALEEGRLPVEHLRGRSGLPPAVQAAEILLRRELGLTDADAAPAVAQDPPTFALAEGRWVVRVDPRPLPARQVSCHGDKLEAPVEWRLRSIEREREVIHV